MDTIDQMIQIVREENGISSVISRESVMHALQILDKRMDKIKERIDSRLEARLVEMKEGYDDSITGLNDAWDIVRKVFEDERGA